MRSELIPFELSEDTGSRADGREGKINQRNSLVEGKKSSARGKISFLRLPLRRLFNNSKVFKKSLSFRFGFPLNSVSLAGIMSQVLNILSPPPLPLNCDPFVLY